MKVNSQNMLSSQSIGTLLKRLWRHIDRRRRWQLGFLLVLMISSAFAEIVSIGAVVPFLAVLTAPDRIFNHPAAQPWLGFFGVQTTGRLLLLLTVAFAIAAVVAGGMRLLLLWINNRLSNAIATDLSVSIYRRTLYQPYAIHIARNSSEIISGIANKTSSIVNTITMTLTFIGSVIMMGSILAALVVVNPIIAVAAFSGFGIIYAAIVWVTRKRLSGNSERISFEVTQVVKSLQEGLGGIRDVLIDGSQAVYCQIFGNADLKLRRAQASSSFISASPRYVMEALGLALIAGLSYILAQDVGGIERAIPVLGALALGAQRLLPILQQAYAAWSTIQGAQASLKDSLDLLDQPLPLYANQPAVAPLPFKHQITLRQLAFQYHADAPLILDNINLVIQRGNRIGFIGATGSGKSTLLDIVMGLLQPTGGEILIDEQVINSSNQRAWQAHIAHVPQSIFLTDGTIAENIAFGLPSDQIDYDRVKEVARQAQIADAVESWQFGYETVVGERGVRLSGGQRQRLGIARALYKHADVLIFDEATSALDNETEAAVVRAIEGLSTELTVLIIAHRLTTLKSCTKIVELGERGVLRVGSYADMVESQKFEAIESNSQ